MVTLSDLVHDDDKLYHKVEITGRFGHEFWDEVVQRGVDTSVYTRHECEVMLDDALAYWLARATLDDPATEPLVATLGPDFMQHVMLLYTRESHLLFLDLAGVFLHHDPAGDAALVNRGEDIAKTLRVFARHGIAYHPSLWMDQVYFKFGAKCIRTGIVGEPAPAALLSRYAGTMAG